MMLKKQMGEVPTTCLRRVLSFVKRHLGCRISLKISTLRLLCSSVPLKKNMGKMCGTDTLLQPPLRYRSPVAFQPWKKWWQP